MELLALALVGVATVAALPYLCYLGLYAWIRPGGSPAEKEPAEPTVSVLLPTYNEAAIVETKLDDLFALDYPMEKIEVLLADSSDDGTAAVARDYVESREGPTPELTVVHEDERRGVAPAINRAMESVSGEVVLRTDCDSKLGEAVLREAVANLSDPEVGAVTGHQAAVLGDSQVEADYRDILTRLQGLESHLDSTFIFHGPCFAFAREDFDPIAPDSLADDTEIALRIRRGGKRVVMDPAMRFVESGVSAFGKRRTRKDRRAMGLVQQLVRNRDMLGRYGRYGRVVLPFNWWFMVASPWLALLSGLLAVALAGLVTPLAAVGVLAAVGAFFWLGQRDWLGPVQPLYAVVDSWVSLFVAQLRLVGSDATGVWEVDRESREAFE